jgi:hypothetical protein
MAADWSIGFAWGLQSVTCGRKLLVCEVQAHNQFTMPAFECRCSDDLKKRSDAGWRTLTSEPRIGLTNARHRVSSFAFRRADESKSV